MKKNYEAFLKHLKQECNQMEIPNYAEKICKNVHIPEEPVSKTTFVGHSLRFVKVATFCCLIIVIGIFIFPKGIKPPHRPTRPKIDEVYAFQAVSAAGFIQARQKMVYQRIQLKKDTTSCKEVAQELHKYIITIEQLLTGKACQFTTEVSDQPEYEFKMIIQTTFAQQVNIAYVLYYNKILTNTSAENKKYDLMGMMMIDGERYMVEGKQKVNAEEDESEFKIYTTSDNYFIIEQSLEKEEQSFVYTEYEKHKKISELEIEIETSGQQKTLALSATIGKLEGEYECILQEGNILIACEYGEYEGEIIVTLLDGNRYQYYFLEEDQAYILKLA